jgi:deoxyadenosine/deoxycytidine kinase
MQKQDFHIIAIEGNIGAGKSTVLGKLQDALNEREGNGKPWQILYEEVESDPEFQRLLKAFTQDPTQRIAFQRYITERRADVCRKLDPNYNYVIERSLFSDLVFCQANLMEACRPDGQDLSYYYDIERRLEDYPQVSSVVYLKTDPEVCYNRMLSRGRDAENGTPFDYIKLLSGMHDTLLPVICNKYNTSLLVHDWTYFGCPETLAERVLQESLSLPAQKTKEAL